MNERDLEMLEFLLTRLLQEQEAATHLTQAAEYHRQERDSIKERILELCKKTAVFSALEKDETPKVPACRVGICEDCPIRPNCDIWDGLQPQDYKMNGKH